MEVKTYRAGSLQEALQQVRRELGPEASVLHTREVGSGMFRWIAGRRVEVTASAAIDVPSRMPGQSMQDLPPLAGKPLPPADYDDFRAKFRENLKRPRADVGSLVEHLSLDSPPEGSVDLPEGLFRALNDLVASGVTEELSRELVERVKSGLPSASWGDGMLVRSRLLRQLEGELKCSGPLHVAKGENRVVALVGPTGVGKTTTIAKLAANFHLREKQRVGLITVDTYRIAAVDQLRTYADIIDLPMEVVSTPREMRSAISRLSHLDLILLDTAGRSPKDDLQLQELRVMLNEAKPDDVHVVLSAVASTSSMTEAAQRFAEVGATSMLVTKLDESVGLGGLLPVLRDSQLPISYITDGQNVPDDIAPAERRKLAKAIFSQELR